MGERRSNERSATKTGGERGGGGALLSARDARGEKTKRGKGEKGEGRVRTMRWRTTRLHVEREKKEGGRVATARGRGSNGEQGRENEETPRGVQRARAGRATSSVRRACLPTPPRLDQTDERPPHAKCFSTLRGSVPGKCLAVLEESRFCRLARLSILIQNPFMPL